VVPDADGYCYDLAIAESLQAAVMTSIVARETEA